MGDRELDHELCALLIQLCQMNNFLLQTQDEQMHQASCSLLGMHLMLLRKIHHAIFIVLAVS